MPYDERPRMPADDSLVTVLARFREDGWTTDHRIRPDARLECGHCSATWNAADAEVEARHRVEGTSDPDDLQLVVGVRCPVCSAPGRVVLAFGPQVPAEQQDVLAALDLTGAGDPLAAD